jgi:hypothetical protein
MMLDVKIILSQEMNIYFWGKSKIKLRVSLKKLNFIFYIYFSM